MATAKQIGYIESLMSSREIGDLADDLVARTICAGRGEELSTRQASEFIDMLLNNAPSQTARTIPETETFAKGDRVKFVNPGLTKTGIYTVAGAKKNGQIRITASFNSYLVYPREIVKA